MHIGCVVGSDGRTKRSWAIVSGEWAVPIENGDEVIEWEIDHGQDEEDVVTRLTKLKTALATQDALGGARNRAAVLALSEPHAQTRQQRMLRGAVALPAGQESLYRSDGKLASRTKGDRTFPAEDLDHQKQGQLVPAEK